MGHEPSCAEVRERLGRFIADELPVGERAGVEGHLGGCGACRGLFDEQADLDAALAGSFAGHPFDERLAERIVAEIGGRGRRGSDRILRGPGAAGERRVPLRWAAAAAVLVAAGAVTLLRTDDSARPQDGSVAVQSQAIAHVHGASAGARISVSRGEGIGSGVTAAPGQSLALAEGDRVRVDRGGAEIAFHDGATVKLRPGTEVVVARWKATEQSGAAVGLRLDHPGEVYAAVARRGVGAAFRVDTPHGSTEVLGTRFGVRVTPGHALTSVLDGKVRVRDADGRLAVAFAGEQVIAMRGQRLATRKAEVERALSWALDDEELEPAAAAAEPTRPVRPLPVGPSSAPGGPTTAPGPGIDLPIGPGER